MQTYAEPVSLKYGKLATKYRWIYGYFFTVYARCGTVERLVTKRQQNNAGRRITKKCLCQKLLISLTRNLFALFVQQLIFNWHKASRGSLCDSWALVIISNTVFDDFAFIVQLKKTIQSPCSILIVFFSLQLCKEIIIIFHCKFLAHFLATTQSFNGI